MFRCVRIWTDREGISEFEEGFVELPRGEWADTLSGVCKSASISFRETAPGSAYGWNNAGTGHAANCELNYTPQRADGTIGIHKVLDVNVEFDISRQLWSHLVRKAAIKNPKAILHVCPHMSFVTGEDNVDFLRKRFDAMTTSHCHCGMGVSDASGKIEQWTPLVIEGRPGGELVAATPISSGADVDDGALAYPLMSRLSEQNRFAAYYRHRAIDLALQDDRKWRIEVENTTAGDKALTIASFVFIGAGGASIEVLEKRFADRLTENGWLPRLREVIPTYGIDLRADTDTCRKIRSETAPVPGLEFV